MFTYDTVIKMLLDMIFSITLRTTPNRFIPGKNPGRENEVAAYIENSRKMDVWLTLQEVVLSFIEENNPSHDQSTLQLMKSVIMDKVISYYHIIRDSQKAAFSFHFEYLPFSIYPPPSVINLCKSCIISMVETKDSHVKNLITEHIENKNSDPFPEDIELYIKSVFLESQRNNAIREKNNEHVKIITHDLLHVASSIFNINVKNGIIQN